MGSIEDTEQRENNAVPVNLRPWQYKKGQSGNPGGRPAGKSLKQYTREKLAAMTDEEREKFLDGLSKDTLWEMAEGKAPQDIKHSGEMIQYVVERGNNYISPAQESTGDSTEPSTI
jgi:hypothetical protein